MVDEDFTPYALDADVVGDAAGYISDGLAECHVQIIDEQPVALQLPQSVALEVIDTPPELKGGTATKRPKPAKLSTGIEIQVPEYVGNGERVWVNTTTGEFGGRRSEEHTSELQSLMRISYAVFCLKKQTTNHTDT